MDSDLPPCPFDDARAGRYRPRDGFVKTAILVEPADADAVTVIATSFGEQRLTGAFYIVAEGDGSYGSARHEFESSHTRVGTNRWVKDARVDAYQTDDECVVDTVVDDRRESSVTAQPGDWIMRQQTGEVMVLRPTEFAERYVSDG